MTDRTDGDGAAAVPGRPDATDGDEEATGQGATGPGTLGYWFWGTLLAFGAFLVLVPGRDPRAGSWLWVGVVLAVASLAGLAVAVRGRRRQ